MPIPSEAEDANPPDFRRQGPNEQGRPLVCRQNHHEIREENAATRFAEGIRQGASKGSDT